MLLYRNIECITILFLLLVIFRWLKWRILFAVWGIFVGEFGNCGSSFWFVGRSGEVGFEDF
jgi:hypothetical protein